MSDEPDLKTAIKKMMIDELMLEEELDEIGDDLPVFGPEGLGLDSVDALQLVVGLEKGFGLKISDAAAAKETLQDVNHMAEAIEAFRAGKAS